MAEFKTDYIISWDFKDGDFPTVSISRLRTEEKSPHLMVDVLESFHSKCGVASLRQIVDDFDRETEV